MQFPFTFQFSVPGLLNPFSSRQSTSAPSCDKTPQSAVRHVKVHRRPPSPASSLSAGAPLSRKRGWVPSFAEPSQSTISLSSYSASGYLDTPAKYKSMAQSAINTEHDDEEMEAELPPAKRRRGLGGSIVSTALSAALIGTAVGLTVYRLWRDRGKQPEPERLAPPPPYQQGEWVPVRPHTTETTPPTPIPRKSRLPVATTSKRSTARRRTRTRPIACSPPKDLHAPKRRHFDHGDDNEDGVAVEDQMDWIGDKLSMLIAEGKKALGAEIVIASDAPEDQVDDGTGVWEEEDDLTTGRPSPRAGSIPRRSDSVRQRPLPINYTGSLPSSSSIPIPSQKHAYPESLSPSYNTAGGGFSLPHTPQGSGRWTEENGQSPELREYMEKARARYRGRP